MTVEALWSLFCENDQSLYDEENMLHTRVGGLKNAVETAYAEGYLEGALNERLRFGVGASQFDVTTFNQLTNPTGQP